MYSPTGLSENKNYFLQAITLLETVRSRSTTCVESELQSKGNGTGLSACIGLHYIHMGTYVAVYCICVYKCRNVFHVHVCHILHCLCLEF